jgi:hypothetical protein
MVGLKWSRMEEQNWGMMHRIILYTVTVWLLFLSTVLAQDAVPSEILGRTFFIKIGNMTGTAFTIDHGGKVYLVTARHLVSGLPERNATIQIRRADQWEDYHTVKTLFPPSKEVDIGVLETNEKVSQPYEIQPRVTAMVSPWASRSGSWGIRSRDWVVA